MFQSTKSSATREPPTLYIPGIFSAPSSNAVVTDSCRSLETLLVRADQKCNSTTPGYENSLFALFGIHKKENVDLPIAAVTRMLDMGVIDNDWWMRADPVHLGLDRERLILIDARRLSITQEEASRLAAEIMEVFTVDGWLLKAPCPERWYLKPGNFPNITMTPLTQVIGRDIHPFLPQGPDSKPWHTTLNEIQILLHTSIVNLERERNGKLPINSLWFWGGGCLPRITPASWAQIWSDEPVSQSLARMSDTPWDRPPNGFDDWYQRAEKPGNHLIILNDIQYAALYEDASRWDDALHSLEVNWMKPILHALKAGTVSSVTLLTDTGTSFSLSSRGLRRWWRLRRSLGTYSDHHNS